jgi:carbon-monoxide dehydrogenase medium subunit
VIGAGTVHHDVATSALLQKRCPIVSEAAATIGDPQVRNRGTIGGSVAHADPSADMPAVLIALDAEIHLKGPAGWRVVKAPSFFQDLFTVDMAADEIIASIQFVPVATAAYAKLRQRASHYAIVGVAAALDVKDGKVASARIGLTGATSHAVRLAGVEQALVGRSLSKASVAAAAQTATLNVAEINADIHASAEYRLAMIPVFTRRALEGAMAR